MSQIRVNRYQYGVGQGCFHAQEISLNSHTFRLVYDCGGKKKDIDWCINHLTNQHNQQPSTEKTVIDVFYLSHFEEDHLNGLKELANQAEIKKIVLPYIDENHVLTLIAHQIFTHNSISPKSSKDLTNIAQGRPIEGLEHIPVIRVRPNDDLPPDIDEIPQDTTDFGGDEIKDDLPKTSETIGNKRTTLSLGPNFWELLHWAYNPSYTNTLSTLVKDKLRAKFGGTPENIDDICSWIDGKYKQIKEAYQAALDEYNKTTRNKIETNHNIVSLCLYSGPLNRHLEHYNSNSFPHWWPSWHFCGCFQRKHQFKDCICGIRLGAWIGTGDAMLGLNDVWSSFQKYFGKRLDLCATVLIPHHGAGAKNSHNYRSELVQHNRNCVISAGANNRYRHPHKDVLIDILSRSGRVIIVNENDKLGFIEHVKFS